MVRVLVEAVSVMVVLVTMRTRGWMWARDCQGGGVERESVDAEKMSIPVFVLAEHVGDSLGDRGPLKHLPD